MALGVTGVMAADQYPYLQSKQIFGLIPGVKGAADPDAADELGAQYARDRERAIAERDRRIEEIRRG